MMMTMARMTINSGNPIRPMMKLLMLLAGQKLPGCARRNRLDCTTRWAGRRIVDLVGLLILAGLETAAVPLPVAQFASGVDLVEVYATVTDAGEALPPK